MFKAFIGSALINRVVCHNNSVLDEIKRVSTIDNNNWFRDISFYKMSKKPKVRIIEALEFSQGNQSSLKSLVYKVQLCKDSEPITMFYDEIRYTYPLALIDFYESKSDFFKVENEETLEEIQSKKYTEDIFDYDTHAFNNGSKILEHVNSLTLCLKKETNDSEDNNSLVIEKVFKETILQFYQNFIIK